MTTNDLKPFFINAFSLSVSFTNVESSLKIILLLTSIVYTILKIKEIYKNRNDKKL